MNGIVPQGIVQRDLGNTKKDLQRIGTTRRSPGRPGVSRPKGNAHHERGPSPLLACSFLSAIRSLARSHANEVRRIVRGSRAFVTRL